MPGQLPYLSAPWFDRVRDLTDEGGCDPKSAGRVLNVQHLIVDPERPFVHRMRLTEQGVASWAPGSFNGPDITIVRTAGLDFTDLMGLEGAPGLAEGTLVRLHDGSERNLLGVPLTPCQKQLSAVPFSYPLAMELSGGPMGPFQSMFSVNSQSGLVPVKAGVIGLDPSVIIRSSYELALRWIHTPAFAYGGCLPGSNGVQVGGEFSKLTALWGVVEMCRDAEGARILELLLRYRDYRTLSATTELFSRLYDETGPPEVLG